MITLGMQVEEHEEKLKPAIAKMFSIMHRSVSVYSQKMLDELKRHNYVTPTNYLELVSGYKSYVIVTFWYLFRPEFTGYHFFMNYMV